MKKCSWFIKLKSEVNRLEQNCSKRRLENGSKTGSKIIENLIRKATYKIDSICISSNGTLSRKFSQSSRTFRIFLISQAKTVYFRLLPGVVQRGVRRMSRNIFFRHGRGTTLGVKPWAITLKVLR